jgi:D-3-phosphoglycerate dehydrogenase / 2-oxoglutarate reductase
MQVLFIDSVHPILKDTLSSKGFTCVDGTNLSREQILEIIHEFHGIVIRSRFRIDDAFIQHAKKLIFIARSGSGMENIDLISTESNGIICFNSPEGNRDAVAEHAVGMLLALFNNLTKGDREVKSGIWKREENRGLELCGKTVGIVGYGFMGEAFAKRLQGFNVNIIAFDKYKKNFGNEHVKEVSIDDIFNLSDVASFHLPLTNETKYMVNSSYLSQFKKPFYLINTSRGDLLDTASLIQALTEKSVLGACLDVIEFEDSAFENTSLTNNEVFKQLIHHPNVILSPHVAGWTTESYTKLSSVLAEKILNHFK